MTTFTYSQARQRLADLLDRATREGQVIIRRRDGRSFIVRPVSAMSRRKSALDVPGLGLGMTRQEIIGFIQQGRRK